MNYEKILCVDLRQFQPHQKDLGVKDYLDHIGFLPDRLVFLNFFPDFIHQHETISQTPLNRMTVGQRGMPSQHRWTQTDLKQLINAVHEHGIKASLGILATTKSAVWKEVEVSWDYEEVLQTQRGNRRMWGDAINVLKRFSNGRYYEDEFIEKLARVLVDYDFDGYVAGDGMLGLRGPRETLKDTDFSMDMVDQFCHHSKVSLPKMTDYDARADYIMKNHHRQWIDFHVDRWAVHVRKIHEKLAPLHKSFLAIDAWSRNPEEIRVAFGIDYRKLYENGLQGVFVQARETNKWRKHQEGEYVKEPNSIYTFLAHKAYEPRLAYYWAEATVNAPEFWNSMLDLPHVLERETFAYLWNVHHDGDRFRPAVDGICVIWGNDITSNQWRWLKNRWDTAYDCLDHFESPLGITLIHDDERPEESSLDSIQMGHAFASLIESGLCIQSVISSRNTQAVIEASCKRPCLAVSPGLQEPKSVKDNFFWLKEDGIMEKVSGQFRCHGFEGGVRRLKERSDVETDKGRIMGFWRSDHAMCVSIENPENLFYEEVRLKLKASLTGIEVLEPRQWYSIPDSTIQNETLVSVAPDASTQAIVRVKD